MIVNKQFPAGALFSKMAFRQGVFNCYKKLIHLRKKYPVFVQGSFRMHLEDDENIFAYTRTDEESRLLVICNFYDKTVSCKALSGRRCRRNCQSDYQKFQRSQWIVQILMTAYLMNMRERILKY